MSAVARRLARLQCQRTGAAADERLLGLPGSTMSTHTTASLPFDAATVEFDPLLRRLNLANTRRHWRDLLERAETHGWSCREFLGVVITEEIAHRQQTRVQRAVQQARFPFLKTIEEFDFSLQSTVRLPLLGTYLAPELVTGAHSLILKGKSGRGKTHLAIAIAYRAIQHGFTARFVTAAALIEELSEATGQGRLQPPHPHPLLPPPYQGDPMLTGTGNPLSESIGSRLWPWTFGNCSRSR